MVGPKFYGLRTLRRRLVGEYPLGLITGYLAVSVGVVSQICLMPIYLANLGVETLGVLVLILGLINYAAIGIYWLIGGLQRVFGETFSAKNNEGFVQALDVGKFIFIAYAVAAALTSVGILIALGRSQILIAVSVVAGFVLVAIYESAVERLALTATGRLAASNMLQVVQVGIYSVSVFFVLRAGGGLLSVFACQMASILVARVVTPLCWQGLRPLAQQRIPPLRPLLTRLTGRMGGGYLIYGALLLSTQSDVLVVGWLGGAEAAAQFVLLWKIAEVGVFALWRIPESLAPFLVRLDAVGDTATIRRQYVRVGKLLLTMAILGGLAYALLGPWITTLWLGAEHAPHNALGFALAGSGILWMGLARLPSSLSYALARLRLWNSLSFIEVAARLGLTVVLYPRFGYLSPLVALNIVHICGIAVAYQWAGWRLITKRV